MSQIQTIAKLLAQQISDVCMEYFVPHRDKKSDIITYNTLCWLEESADSLLAKACRLLDEDLISGEVHSTALYVSRLAHEKKADLLYTMHCNGFNENDEYSKAVEDN